MEDRPAEVDAIESALVIDLFEFSDKVGHESMRSEHFFLGDLALVKDANGTDEFAEILEIRVGKNAVEKPRAQDENICEELPGFVATGNFLSRVARRSVE
jgi:hypothetical protein